MEYCHPLSELVFSPQRNLETRRLAQRLASHVTLGPMTMTIKINYHIWIFKCIIKDLLSFPGAHNPYTHIGLDLYCSKAWNISSFSFFFFYGNLELPLHAPIGTIFLSCSLVPQTFLLLSLHTTPDSDSHWAFSLPSVVHGWKWFFSSTLLLTAMIWTCWPKSIGWTSNP